MAMAETSPPESAGLAEAAERLSAAVEEPEGWRRAGPLLHDLERALLSLSAGWHNLAPLAAPTVAAFRSHAPHGVDTGLSREQEVQLMSVLHDLSTDLSAAARSCRNARSIVAPLIARRLEARAERDHASAD